MPFGFGKTVEPSITMACREFRSGIVTPKFLIANTKYAVLIITVVAAIVTPTPDALTMLMVMAVMTGLYFVGVGVSWVVVRKRERRLAAEAQG